MCVFSALAGLSKTRMKGKHTTGKNKLNRKKGTETKIKIKGKYRNDTSALNVSQDYAELMLANR